jgi:hypothetical protein
MIEKKSHRRRDVSILFRHPNRKQEEAQRKARQCAVLRSVALQCVVFHPRSQKFSRIDLTAFRGRVFCLVRPPRYMISKNIMKILGQTFTLPTSSSLPLVSISSHPPFVLDNWPISLNLYFSYYQNNIC